MTSVGDVLAIIDATIKVVDATRTIYNANKEKEELLKWIQTLADTLRGFVNVSTSLTGQNRIVFDSINAQIDDRMASVRKRLVEEKGGFKRRLNRLLWPARRNKAREDIEAIEKLDDQVRKVFLTQDTEDAKLRRLVAFLTPDVHASLMKTPARVQTLTKGTIEWIWKNEQYLDWGRSESGILWVFEGSGKTGMAEYISSTLREEAGSPPAYHVARVFCDHQTSPGLVDHRDIIMSLWCQLEQSIGGLTVDPETLRRWAPQVEAGPFLPHKNETELKKEVLSYTIAKAGKTLFILDGLDEVPSEYQRDIVEMLRDLMKRNHQCRLMITSRPYASITALVIEEPKLILRATAHDIELYIRDRILRSSSHFLQSHQITEHIITELRSKCDGTFLMAKLHMDEVLKAESESDCWDIIRDLPAEASQAYEKGLMRLAATYRKPEGNIPCSAIQALFWVVFAKAPMTMRQLKQALAVKPTDAIYNSENEIVQGIDTLCGELLVVDPQNQEVRVAHKTISDYLMRPETKRTWFPNIQAHIHLTLIRYLSLRDLSEPLVDPESIKQFEGRHPLLPYSLTYWGTNLSTLLDVEPFDSEIRQVTERFLRSRQNQWNDHVQQEVVKMIEIKSNGRAIGFPEENTVVTPGQIGGLHWVVIFSLRPFIKTLYEHEKRHPLVSGISLSPLGLAAAYDQTAIAVELLEAGSSPHGDDYKGNSMRPPLYDALLFRHMLITHFLLEHGASLTLGRSGDDYLPLDLMYNTDLEEFVPFAVKTISKKHLLNHHEYLFLVKGALPSELKAAIKHGLDINQGCGNGKNALDYALELGNREIITILKQHGAVPKLQWGKRISKALPYVSHCPEPYIPGTRIVELMTWETETLSLTCWDDDPPYYAHDLKDNESSDGNSHLLMEVHVDQRIKLPVRVVVFETVSRDQGWSSHERHHTYLGSTRSWFDVRLVHGDTRSRTLRIQHNVHAAKTFRMHTNIWDLEDTDTLLLLRAKFIESLQHGSILQIFAHAAGGPEWSNKVAMLRVTVYGQV